MYAASNSLRNAADKSAASTMFLGPARSAACSAAWRASTTVCSSAWRAVVVQSSIARTVSRIDPLSPIAPNSSRVCTWAASRRSRYCARSAGLPRMMRSSSISSAGWPTRCAGLRSRMLSSAKRANASSGVPDNSARSATLARSRAASEGSSICVPRRRTPDNHTKSNRPLNLRAATFAAAGIAAPVSPPANSPPIRARSLGTPVPSAACSASYPRYPAPRPAAASAVKAAPGARIKGARMVSAAPRSTGPPTRAAPATSPAPGSRKPVAAPKPSPMRSPRVSAGTPSSATRIPSPRAKSAIIVEGAETSCPIARPMALPG